MTDAVRPRPSRWLRFRAGLRRWWFVSARRTVTAALVLSLIAIAAVVLLSAVPTYRDVWLVLGTVLATGAIGVWRAEIEAGDRERDFGRTYILRRLDETDQFVSDLTDHVKSLNAELLFGSEPSPPPKVPLLASFEIVGNFGVIMRWLQAQPPTTPLPFTDGQLYELNRAHVLMREAIHLQRNRVLSHIPILELTPSQYYDVQRFSTEAFAPPPPPE